MTTTTKGWGETMIANLSYDVDTTYRHRTADATVTVLRPDGAPLADTEVTVAQRSHQFLFG